MKLKKLTIAERFFNASAAISLVVSLTLWFVGFQREALFVGLWVPSILGWMNFLTLKEQSGTLHTNPNKAEG